MTVPIQKTHDHEHVSRYSDHCMDDRNISWYLNLYDDGNSYDSYIWSLERKVLLQIIRKLTSNNKGSKYLDFACGYGRIVSEIEYYVKDSSAVDISPKMIQMAKGKVNKTKLIVGDILENQNMLDYDYDIITAFRFFLNAEAPLRLTIMKSLSSRLRDENSRIIFNIHGNKHSMIMLGISINRKRGQNYREGWGWMSYKEIKQLVSQSGLEIESVYGIGICPIRIHESRFNHYARLVDGLASNIGILKWISGSLLIVCRPRTGRPKIDSA